MVDAHRRLPVRSVDGRPIAHRRPAEQRAGDNFPPLELEAERRYQQQVGERGRGRGGGLVRTAPSRARARTRHPARWREAARAGPTPAPFSRTGAINAAAPIGANPKTGLRSREAAEVRVDGDIHLLDLVRVRGRQPRHLGVAETLQLDEELVCARCFVSWGRPSQRRSARRDTINDPTGNSRNVVTMS